MRWLLTLHETTTPGRLSEMLGPSGSSVQHDSEMIPLDGGEVVVEVDGPADLPDRIKNAPEVKEVYPSSEMTLY